MPTYEYLCSGCETEFEADQRITEDPLKSCPNCKSRKVKRLISKTSFVLKGGGWYSDLYSSSKSGDKSSEKDSSSKDSDGKDSKKEKKAASKSEDKKKSKPAKKKTG